MQRPVVATLIGALILIPAALSQVVPHGYAQTGGPQSDEYNNNTFTAPFVGHCGQNALGTCPDPQGHTTWSLNTDRPGFLRIAAQFGSLVGGATQASNNARNFFTQPVVAGADYTVTTSLTFPGVPSNINAVGQSAGLLVYSNDDNFISLGRTFNSTTGQPEIQFIQESTPNGLVGGTVTDVVSTAPDVATNSTVYLRIEKSGTQYLGSYGYDNTTFTPVNLNPSVTPTATATATGTSTSTATATATGVVPTVPLTGTTTPTATGTPFPAGYAAAYQAPQVGVYSFGGLNSSVQQNPLLADFDWFRVGNSQVAGPTATSTSTATATSTGTATATGTATSTSTATATGTALPTSTATATSTATSTALATATATSTTVPTATSTTVPTATDTPMPTPTPKPAKPSLGFKYVSIWYHVIKRGTTEHIEAQARRSTTHGIWVHVYFANGRHFDYYQNTSPTGFWSADFTIPRDATSRFGGNGVVTFQLWKGRSSAQRFDTFTVV